MSDLPEGWIETTLGQSINLVGGGTPKTSILEYWNGEIPWLSVVDFNDANRWVLKTEKTITEKGLNHSSTKLLNEGDLIISARGTVGALAQLKEKMAFNQSCYGIRNIEGVSNINFLYYLIKYSLRQIGKNIHGAVFDTITRQTFDNIQISLPPLLEQKAIAKILSSFDEKIELLREQNETLENIAQTIFKEWFVNFNYPDASGEFVDTELGKIPKNWTVGLLGDVAKNISRRFVFEGKDEVVFINTGDVQNGKFLHRNYISSQGLPGQAKKAIEKWDILYSEIRPINKRFARVDFDTKDFVASTKFMIIKNNQSVGYNFLYILLSSAQTLKEFQIIAESRSGTFPQITFEAISKFNFPLPPNDKLIVEFEKIVGSFYKKISENDEHLKILSKVRKTLLPKLMSGEVRVKGFEQ